MKERRINFGDGHAQIKKVLPHDGTFHFEIEKKIVRGHLLG